MDIQSFMRAVNDDNPTEAEAAFNSIMADKITSKLEDRASEIGNSIGYRDFGDADGESDE